MAAASMMATTGTMIRDRPSLKQITMMIITMQLKMMLVGAIFLIKHKTF